MDRRRNFLTWRQSRAGTGCLEFSAVSIPKGSPDWVNPWAIFDNGTADAALSTRMD